MNDIFKRIIIVFLIIAIGVSVVSVLFFGEFFKPAREIENADNLTGQRIGVVTAYDADYLLSNRDDLTLLRYDSFSEALVALYYKQIDAFATTLENANYILELTSGFVINDVPIAVNGMAPIFRKGDRYLTEFNEFVEYYKETEEYSEYIEKCNNNDYYDGSEITEETGTGEVFTVGYCTDYIPVDFYDTINKCANGSEVDFIRRFANYMNYKIEWVEITTATSYEDLSAGKIDIILDGYSDVYRGEFDIDPLYDMAVNYRESVVALVEVDDYGNISIGGVVEEEE